MWSKYLQKSPLGAAVVVPLGLCQGKAGAASSCSCLTLGEPNYSGIALFKLLFLHNKGYK